MTHTEALGTLRSIRDTLSWIGSGISHDRLRARLAETNGKVAEVINYLSDQGRLSGPPVIEPVNPYRPETELVRVPREDEEALTDTRVPVRIGLDERTRFDRRGEGDQ